MYDKCSVRMKVVFIKNAYLVIGIVFILVAFFIKANKEFFLLLGLVFAMFKWSFEIYTTSKAFKTILVSSMLVIAGIFVGFIFNFDSLNGLLIIVVGLVGIFLIVSQLVSKHVKKDGMDT